MTKTVTFATTVLENAHVRVEYRPKPTTGGRDRADIGGDDKTDKFNLPRFFTQNKRGLDKQWLHLTAAFTPETTYRDAIRLLSAQGAKVHDYCAMD